MVELCSVCRSNLIRGVLTNCHPFPHLQKRYEFSPQSVVELNNNGGIK